MHRILSRHFDGANPCKGGTPPFFEVPAEHDVTDEYAAYKLSDTEGSGAFGIFYQVTRPTKNANEARLIAEHRAKVGDLAD